MSWKTLPGTMNDWSPEQLLAIHEFCQLMAELIWQHHGEQLIEYLRDETVDYCANNQTTSAGEDQQLSLIFDDNLTF